MRLIFYKAGNAMRLQACMLLLMLGIITKAQEVTPQWARELPVEKDQRMQFEKDQRMQWWRNARFGMFIHWGLYAVPARHEWVQSREQLTKEQYQKYFNVFNPDLYDPKLWARKAKEAGMKYVVITAKHHDGFCLWNSSYTDFKAINTPAKQDLLKPMVDAFRAEGIRIGFYYSLIDWHHPDFTIDRNHPLRADVTARKGNTGRDMEHYRQYVKNQITELLTQYGKIDELFFDYSYPGDDGKGKNDWNSKDLLQHVRKLQPQIIVNDRLDLHNTAWGWDYITPEQFMPQAWPVVNGAKVPWETCQTFSGSWGYNRDEYSWKSAEQLIAMLIETVSKGGNLLLNIGPNARGQLDKRSEVRLQEIAAWMNVNSRSIYGCTQAPDSIKTPANCLLTYNAQKKRLYIHVLSWPFKSLHLPGLKNKFNYAQLLDDGSEIKYKHDVAKGSHTTEQVEGNDVILELPVQKPSSVYPVIELFMN